VELHRRRVGLKRDRNGPLLSSLPRIATCVEGGCDPEQMGSTAEEEYDRQTKDRSTMGQEDVLLDVPRLHIDSLDLEVSDLRAHVSLHAEVLSLLRLVVGIDANLGQVRLDLRGVDAQALLKVRLENVATILDRVLTTIESRPEIVESLVRSTEQALRQAGQGAGQALGQATQGAGQALGQATQGAGQAAGQLARAAQEAGQDVGQATRQAQQAGQRAGQQAAREAQQAGQQATREAQQAQAQQAQGQADQGRQGGPGDQGQGQAGGDQGRSGQGDGQPHDVEACATAEVQSYHRDNSGQWRPGAGERRYRGLPRRSRGR
jgi:hypothetical protein